MPSKIICLFFFFEILEINSMNVLPEIVCPPYFSYVYERNRFYGKVTLPNLSSDFTKLDVEMIQNTPVSSGYFGSIALAGSEDDISHDRPVSYRIEFPTPNEVPKLSKISVNDVTICVSNDDESEVIQILTLQHNLTYHSSLPLRGSPESIRPSEVSLDKPSTLFQPIGSSTSRGRSPVRIPSNPNWMTSVNAQPVQKRDHVQSAVIILPAKKTSSSQSKQFEQRNPNIWQRNYPFDPRRTSLNFPKRASESYSHQQQTSTTVLNTNDFTSTSLGLPIQSTQSSPASTTPVFTSLHLNEDIHSPLQSTPNSPAFRTYTENSNLSPIAIQDRQASAEETFASPSFYNDLNSQGSETSSPTCGVNSLQFTPFIYGGHAISRGQMPWIAPIYRKDSANLHFLCSGSLISASTVITAAHCVMNHFKLTKDRMVVYLGRYDLDNYSEDGYQVRELRNFIVHQEYKEPKISDADIALLILNVPVTFTKFVAPVCLWQEDPRKPIDTRGNAFIAGWGADEYGHQITRVPKMVSVKLINYADCANYPEFTNFVTSRTLCAGNDDGSGPCLGDSGAGLIINHENRWMIRAIVSGGSKSAKPCDKNLFAVYCDLSKHIDWIQKNMIP